MLTLFFIGVVIYVIYALGDHRDKDQIASNRANLPNNIQFNGNRLGTGMKLLNLCSSGDLLQSFTYDNGVVTIVMQNGQSISDRLARLRVNFVRYSNSYITYANVKTSNGNKVSIVPLDNVLSNDEWSSIYYVLSLAGKVSGKPKIGYSTLDKAKIAGNLFRLFS